MNVIRRAVDIASRRSIRSARDLRLYTARMTVYIVVMTILITVVQTWRMETSAMIWTVLGAGVVSAVLSLPITWEFGRMYLDLWNSTQQLRDLATKDLQTGLLNNRSFIAAVEERLAVGRQVALFVGDLDRFKSVNDLHGHLAGDDVIAKVGAAIRLLFGTTAVLGRMGGEEYAVMIECPFIESTKARAHAGALAEEMRRRVADIVVPTETGMVTPTISIGIAWSTPDGTFSDLYSRADKALYVAKTAGRNRVIGEHEVEVLDPERLLAKQQDLFWRDSRLVGAKAAPEPASETASIAWA